MMHLLWRVVVVVVAFAATPPTAQSAQTGTAAAPQADAPDDDQAREQEAIQYMKTFLASRIEPVLPHLALELWLHDLLGPERTWEMNDCGEGPQPDTSGPVCVQIDDASKHVALMLTVPPIEDRATESPKLLFGAIRLLDVDRSIRRLADLPGLLKEAEIRRARFRNYPLRNLTLAEAVRASREVPAAVLDERLPREPFESWLTSLFPVDAKLEWLMEPCGGRNTQPACLLARVAAPNGSVATVGLDLELVQRGLSQEPSFWSAYLYDRQRIRIDTFKSLNEFAVAAASLR